MRYLDPKNDLIFKRVFGEHPNITISFLNALLPLEDGNEIISIEYMQTELVPEKPHLIKNSIVDVRCKDSFERQFIVEMQMIWAETFKYRVLFNASKTFVRQLQKTEDYIKLKTVYALSLIDDIFDKESEESYHHYKLTNQNDLTKTIDGMELIFVELPKYKLKNLNDKKLNILWLRYLTEMEKLMDMQKANISLPEEILQAIELTHESNYTPEQLAAYDKYIDAIRTEKTLIADAEARGEAKGEARGEARGEVKGKVEGAIATAKNLKNLDLLTNQQIADATGLTLSEVEAL
ncbi:MAG TPA: Rpn family recombination-promoting nuclease/putative transposase [Saprospiraceae bacterium]|nr:Rpn family recombination-promoting nuclease/putative transposase [Saprospiraceae bacterium]HPN69143.1 Rpn family recombination-promoting nuclease/putative transposase [Saprospiraceae bacterium]